MLPKPRPWRITFAIGNAYGYIQSNERYVVSSVEKWRRKGLPWRRHGRLGVRRRAWRRKQRRVLRDRC